MSAAHRPLICADRRTGADSGGLAVDTPVRVRLRDDVTGVVIL